MFSGYLIPFHQIQSYFKWLYWCSPFAYAFKALQITLYRDYVFTDCVIPPACYSCIQCFLDKPQCAEIANLATCYATGTDYLQSVNADPAKFGLDLGVLAAIFGVLFILGYVSMKVFVERKTN
jgi:hypothetical protein